MLTVCGAPCRGDVVTLDSADIFTASVLTDPDGSSALVCLAGEIDMTASAALTKVAEQLSTVAPVQVVIDLTEVTFAGATLPNFVADVHRRLPTATTLLLCGPDSSILQVLQASGMEQIATLRSDLRIPTARRRPGPAPQA